MTPGGRGGQVIEVTNLNDAGPGSLREALEAEGARIVVFRTGGTIELRSRIKVTEPFLTIAGQTAPGDGITLKNHGLRILTHDVIIRYMRFRPGDDSVVDATNVDGINIVNAPENSDDTDSMAHSIILDHVSVSWAIDKNIGIWNSRPDINDIEKITVQWSIISEALSYNRHAENEHSRGLLLGEYMNNISIHHNLFAHNTKRNPRVKGGSAEVINNVIYNDGSDGLTVLGSGAASDPAVHLNYISNYERTGPNSSQSGNMVIISPVNQANLDKSHRIYVKGNIGGRRSSSSQNEWLVVSDRWGMDSDGAAARYKKNTPFIFPGPSITTQPYRDAYDSILLEAGASLVRDKIDARIISDVVNQTGQIIDNPEQVGGYPRLARGTPPIDTDHDGMPNWWELETGLNPLNKADGGGDLDGDGYTNIEEFLNGTNPNSGRKPGTEDCHTSQTTWQNNPIETQDGSFEVEFTVIPHQNNLSGLAGLSLSAAEQLSDFAALLRLNQDGFFDACNGACQDGNFESDVPVPYTADGIYHFRAEISVPDHNYSIYVTPAGAGEPVSLAHNYHFQIGQDDVPSLSNWALQADTAAFTICPFVLVEQ